MLKVLTASTIVAASIAAFAGQAYAAPVHVCYKLDPFSDVLKLVRNDPGKFGHRSLYGNWVASGQYTIPVSGAFEFDAGTATRKVSVVGANSAAAFGDNLLCGLTGIPGGAWELNCAGGPGASFQNTGTSLTLVSCAGLPTSAQSERAAGEQ